MSDISTTGIITSSNLESMDPAQAADSPYALAESSLGYQFLEKLARAKNAVIRNRKGSFVPKQISDQTVAYDLKEQWFRRAEVADVTARSRRAAMLDSVSAQPALAAQDAYLFSAFSLAGKPGRTVGITDYEYDPGSALSSAKKRLGSLLQVQPPEFTGLTSLFQEDVLALLNVQKGNTSLQGYSDNNTSRWLNFLVQTAILRELVEHYLSTKPLLTKHLQNSSLLEKITHIYGQGGKLDTESIKSEARGLLQDQKIAPKGLETEVANLLESRHQVKPQDHQLVRMSVIVALIQKHLDVYKRTVVGNEILHQKLTVPSVAELTELLLQTQKLEWDTFALATQEHGSGVYKKGSSKVRKSEANVLSFTTDAKGGDPQNPSLTWTQKEPTPDPVPVPISVTQTQPAPVVNPANMPRPRVIAVKRQDKFRNASMVYSSQSPRR